MRRAISQQQAAAAGHAEKAAGGSDYKMAGESGEEEEVVPGLVVAAPGKQVEQVCLNHQRPFSNVSEARRCGCTGPYKRMRHRSD